MISKAIATPTAQKFCISKQIFDNHCLLVYERNSLVNGINVKKRV